MMVIKKILFLLLLLLNLRLALVRLCCWNSRFVWIRIRRRGSWIFKLTVTQELNVYLWIKITIQDVMLLLITWLLKTRTLGNNYFLKVEFFFSVTNWIHLESTLKNSQSVNLSLFHLSWCLFESFLYRFWTITIKIDKILLLVVLLLLYLNVFGKHEHLIDFKYNTELIILD